MSLRHPRRTDGGLEDKEDIMMLSLKNCPRCKGDMHSNRDVYGPYVECLQCGHMDYNGTTTTAGTRLKRGTKKPAAA